MMHTRGRWTAGARCGAALVAACGTLAGCASPVSPDAERSLQESVIEATRRELAEAQRHPEIRTTERQPGTVRDTLSPRVIPELEAMAGPGSFPADPRDVRMGEDLYGQPQEIVSIGLQRAMRSVVERNLELQFGRISPAIRQSQVVAAEAAFDWVFFQNLEYSNTDSRQFAQSTFFPSFDARHTLTSTTGLRRVLSSGGQFTLQQQLSYVDNYTLGSSFFPDPGNQLVITAQLDQPLLRDFGSDVALAQVRLSRNAERSSVQEYRSDILRIVTEAENAYWNLYQAHRDVLILEKLLGMGETVRDQLQARAIIDATPAQIADAVSRVENRKRQLLVAQNNLRRASDRLKQLMNDPEMSVGDEVLLVPLDVPIDAPVRYGKLEALTTAIESRPEVQLAVLSLDDTGIRQTVAANQRLPQLDARLQLRLNGLDEDPGGAYDEAFSGQFIDYLAGLFFEQPVGNRAAEAQFRQRRLERMQAGISYRNTVQNVALEVKTALDSVGLNYRLIEQARDARLAAAEVLRALLVEKETIRALSVERLDLELNRQEQLAQRERDEVQALADYQRAIATLHAAMGTALERNQIELVVPDPEDAITEGGRRRAR